MTSTAVVSTKFNVLDDVSLAARSLLLAVCALTCAWGMHNNAPLLILASKIGFPLVLVPCSIAKNRNHVLSLLYYTLIIVTVGFIYFVVSPGSLDPGLLKLFVPNIVDFGLAIALGMTLSHFWDHALRTNIVVMGAAMSYMLPACVVASYFFSIHDIDQAVISLGVHLLYVLGVFLGVLLHETLLETGNKNEHN